MRLFGGGHGLLGLLIAAVIFVIPLWQIVRKAGYPPPLALLALVPLVNIVALWVFAFSRWPRDRSNG